MITINFYQTEYLSKVTENGESIKELKEKNET